MATQLTFLLFVFFFMFPNQILNEIEKIYNNKTWVTNYLWKKIQIYFKILFGCIFFFLFYCLLFLNYIRIIFKSWIFNLAKINSNYLFITIVTHATHLLSRGVHFLCHMISRDTKWLSVSSLILTWYTLGFTIREIGRYINAQQDCIQWKIIRPKKN